MASRGPIPVLWLCGPPGVGKSTVGWEVFSRLTGIGSPASYIDIDQLGICYPEPDGDPGRYRMKAHNLAAVVATFQASGARAVVVSGVVDPVTGVPADVIPGDALTICRLHASPDELRARLLGRGEHPDVLPSVLNEADALDRSDVAHLCVDTSGLTVAEVTRLVSERTGWPAQPARACAASSVGAPAYGTGPPEPHGPPVLWLCGPTGVGKSTVGWQVHQRIRDTGVTAAYVDLDQIGFCRPPPAHDPGNHRVKARNLAALWDTYRAAGAACLVVVGPVEDTDAVRTYTDALAASQVTVCRLHAGRDELVRRILRRGQGASWAIPGDRLKDQPVAELHRVAAEATVTAEALERDGIGDLRVDTDGQTVEDVASTVLALVGDWPGEASRVTRRTPPRSSRRPG